MAKKAFFFLIKLAFVTLIFVGLFRPELISQYTPEWLGLQKFKGVSLPEIFAALGRVDAGTAAFWLSFAAIVKLGGIFAGVARWNVLLRGQGITLPWWYLTKCWFMGRAIGLWLPGTVGLDGYKLVESSAYTGEVAKCTSVVVVEKLIGFVNLFLLVLLTLPLGLALFNINLVILGAILLILAGFITVAFTFLLQPRIVQVLVSVIPLPNVIRGKIDEFGAAVTAYSHHRRSLLYAVVLGFFVHLGIIFMYFGTSMAVTGGTSSITDILFASPLVIAGSVFAPTVSGIGVREGVMTILLGAKYGTAEAFLWGHLGLWVGEMVPFLLSVPLLLFATRPDRETFMAELEETRRKAEAAGGPSFHLPEGAAAEYSRKFWNAAGAGIMAGLIAGAVFGLAESIWHVSTLTQVTEYSAYWWGPAVYGLAFSGLGLAIAGGLIFLYLAFDRFLPTAWTFGLSFGGTIAAAALVIGRFRFQRDIMEEHALSMAQNLMVAGAAVGAGMVCVILGAMIISFAKRLGGGRPSLARGLAAGLAVYAALVIGGGILSMIRTPQVEAAAFEPEREAAGPNIIFVAVDTLRADYLKLYNPLAAVDTPHISALAEDGVTFENTFAQSSWTKASFGTIFSGMYPEGHTATGKASALPDEVDTIAEKLNEAGYFTKGYSNNPNITSVFNYDQGFHDYVDLKPDLYFGAGPSSEKLVLYDILRKVVQTFYKQMGNRIVITDFYQPADVVTDIALDWIDGDERPDDAPFYLFLHYMDPHDPFRDPERPGKGYARVQLGNPDPAQVIERAAKVGPLEMGDQAVVTIDGTVEGVALPPIPRQEILLGQGELPFEMEAAIAGAEAGEAVTCSVTYDANYPNEQLAGKTAEYAIEVREAYDVHTYVDVFKRSYNYEITTLDEELGRLFAGLKERGLYDDSLIVFTSDHGEEFHEHGGWWHGLSLYEEQICIPLVIKLDGNQMAGQRTSDMARHIDLAPTLSYFAGAVPSQSWKGVPLFIDDSFGNEEIVDTYAHLDFEGIRLRSWRTDKMKLIEANEDNKRNYAPIEIYNLVKDPGEQENLAGDPNMTPVIEQFQQFIDQMEAFIKEGAAEPATDTEATKEMQEQLESLGYF